VKRRSLRASLEIEETSPESIVLRLKGDWTRDYAGSAVRQLDRFCKRSDIGSSSVMFDFSEVDSIDSAGMVLIVKSINRLVKKGCTVAVDNATEEQERLLVFHRKNFRAKKISSKAGDSLGISSLIFGKVIDYLRGIGDFLVFVGELSHYLFMTILKPGTLRVRAIVKHVELSGVKALPIVSLTSFLVGLVVAYQGAEQLQKFGANIFIVEMVSISVFRELAPMITAIVIAGRSASAYTAEIGTMKITEEVDAMRTMGFEPVVFLVIPRMLALMISLPLIVFFADMVGVFGGMIIADLHLDISFTEFIDRMHAEVPLKHIVIGLIKAPVFGMVIAAIGCFRGFQVEGSTDSIGNYTTISVVNAIFWVIALNALFSVILTEIGI